MPGGDQSPSDMLMVLNVVKLWLTFHFSITWKTGMTPEKWQTKMVVPIFENGTRASVLTAQGCIHTNPVESALIKSHSHTSGL